MVINIYAKAKLRNIEQNKIRGGAYPLANFLCGIPHTMMEFVFGDQKKPIKPGVS
jgi:hypothetical protein